MATEFGGENEPRRGSFNPQSDSHQQTERR